MRSNCRLYEACFSVSNQISRIRGLFFSLRSNFRLYKACFSVSNQIFDYTRLIFQLAIKFRVYESCFSVSDQIFVYTRLVDRSFLPAPLSNCVVGSLIISNAQFFFYPDDPPAPSLKNLLFVYVSKRALH